MRNWHNLPFQIATGWAMAIVCRHHFEYADGVVLFTEVTITRKTLDRVSASAKIVLQFNINETLIRSANKIAILFYKKFSKKFGLRNILPIHLYS